MDSFFLVLALGSLRADFLGLAGAGLCNADVLRRDSDRGSVSDISRVVACAEDEIMRAYPLRTNITLI